MLIYIRYISTEMSAGTLKDLVQGCYTGPIIGDRQTVLRQITSGLEHLHKKGIVHRDLKPSNIAISFPDGAVGPMMKLTNFGIIHRPKRISYSSSDSSNLKPVILWKVGGSSKGWMAPEIYTAEEYSCTMDIFTLGCVFGFAFARVHPFGSDKDERIVRIKKSYPMTLTVDNLQNAPNPTQLFQLISSMVNADCSLRPSASDVLQSTFFRRSISTSKEFRLKMIHTKGRTVNLFVTLFIL
jgi:serine/threonine protein kinase